jgi:tetratricopeptide (TPR) repeat protein
VVPLFAQDRLADAEPILNLLRQSRTRVAEVYRDLAALADTRGKPALAAAHRDLWLEHPSEQLQELEAQASLAEQLGRLELSHRLWQALLERNPGHPDACLKVARYLMMAESFDLARRVLRRAASALSVQASSEACALQAACAIELCEPVEALGLARESLRQGESAVAHASLAAALHQLADEPLALAHLQEARCLSDWAEADPPWPIARLLAPICLEQHRLPCAEQLLQIACRQQPASPRLQQQLGELLLLQGEWSRGFELWVASAQAAQWSASGLPMLDPRLPIAPLALVANGTLGDTLLFSRYATWLESQLQVPVHFYVQPPVVALLRGCLPHSVSIHPLAQLPHQTIGSVLPLLSAPGLFGACDREPDLRLPCLAADPERISAWRQRLALEPTERLIAINWHGSAMQALRERVSSDIPLHTFARLAELPNVRLVSLQKGFGAEQLKHCSFRDRFVACQEEINREHRLEEMAALISLCHWVVCDDSGPAHLAGSLQRPTILLLSERGGWRWGSSGQCCPWYPTLQILRRSGETSGWATLMERAASMI